jgi:hypothetical protein
MGAPACGMGEVWACLRRGEDGSADATLAVAGPTSLVQHTASIFMVLLKILRTRLAVRHEVEREEDGLELVGLDQPQRLWRSRGAQ